MIQRIQSLWLLLAALLSAGVLYFSLYTAKNGTAPDTVLRTVEHYPLLLIAVLMIALPFFAVFMFGNRKRQKSMTLFSILTMFAFIGMLVYEVSGINKAVPPPLSGSYGIGSVLPAAAIVALVLAYMGIRKDDKLVKSMDRLR